MAKVYAGIGSRDISWEERDLCFAAGSLLARKGWVLRTGAATGADQAFAEGALFAGGEVTLCLPWWGYEEKWVKQVKGRGAVLLVLNDTHTEAMESVNRFHPRPSALSRGARALHARNFLIVSGCKFVLAWPRVKANGQLGGTGQGIKIAESMGITVFRMNDPAIQKRITKQIIENK